MVFQNYALYPHMSVYNNMAMACATGACRTRDRHQGPGSRVSRARAMLDRKPRNVGASASVSRWTRDRAAAEGVSVRRTLVPTSTPSCASPSRRNPQTAAAMKTTSIYVTTTTRGVTLADILVVMNGGQVEQIGNPLRSIRSPRPPSCPFIARAQ